MATDDNEELPKPTEAEVEAALFRVHKQSKDVLKRYIAYLKEEIILLTSLQQLP